jgi:hypothetical protein
MPVGSTYLPDERERFVGRVQEQQAIRDYFEQSANARPPFPPVVLISGQWGMGKTALARVAADGLADLYPDGIVFTSTREWLDNSPRYALQAMLHTVLPPGTGPSPSLRRSLPKMRSAWQDAIKDRRLLILIDDVESLQQIADVMPSTHTCGAILTSREVLRLPDTPLILSLDPLPMEATLELLARYGIATDANSDEAKALVSRLETPRQLVQVAAALSDGGALPTVIDRLDRSLDAKDSPTRSVLKYAYESLGVTEQRTLRMLGALIHPVFKVSLAAAAADIDAEDATVSLERLAARQLISPTTDGQYQLSDPTFLFAKKMLAEVETGITRQAALDRVFRWVAIATSYQPQPQIAPDRWTVEDRLDYAQYADAIAAFIRHRDTVPPLTIGIKAPWGAGKTSLMRMIQERLDPRHDRKHWTATRLRLTPESRDLLLAPPCGSAPDREVPGPGWFGRVRKDTSGSGTATKRLSNLDLLRHTLSAESIDAARLTLSELAVEPPSRCDAANRQ